MSAIKHLEVDPREAIGALVFMLGWHGGELPVYVDGKPEPAFSLQMQAGGLSEAGRCLWRRATTLDVAHNAQVEVGLPLRNESVPGSTVLWAWVTTPDGRFRASRFRPEPSMVLRFGGGSARLMLWSLREFVGWPSLTPHNERLSYALHSPRTHCAPEKLRVPLPGTFLRVGRSRPVPVLLTRLEATCYTRSQVTATLKDAPSKDAWRERKR